MHRLAAAGLALAAVALGCGRDVTEQPGPPAHLARGLSWNAIFPPAFQAAGGALSGIVPFNRVRVALHHDNGTPALDTVVNFPAGADSIALSLTVRLLDDAPPAGETMTLDLAYLNAGGDTVFKGGPARILVQATGAAGGPNPAVQIPITYSGPGANAVAVVISPRSATVVAGAPFSFEAVAKDRDGAALPGTPLIWSSLDPAIATISSAAAGSGNAQLQRGTAGVVAQLLTGPADTVHVTVILPASRIIALSGDAQTGVAGERLAQPLVVKVAASDGIGVAGTTVNFAVATGGGSVSDASVVSDSNGLARTSWDLGKGAAAQSVTASAASLANSPLTFTATALAATASRLVVTTNPVNGVAGTPLAPVVFTAQDDAGGVATSFTGLVSVALAANAAGATLSGTTTVNAVAGVATFSTLKINRIGTAYTLVASSAGLSSATTGTFGIAAGAPNKLVFTVQPSAAAAGLAISPAIVVTAQDSEGNPTPSFTGAVTLDFATAVGAAARGARSAGAPPRGGETARALAIGPPPVTLDGITTVNAVAGVAVFADVSVSGDGTGFVLSASAQGLAPGTSAAFDVTGGAGGATGMSAGGGDPRVADPAATPPRTVRAALRAARDR